MPYGDKQTVHGDQPYTLRIQSPSFGITFGTTLNGIHRTEYKMSRYGGNASQKIHEVNKSERKKVLERRLVTVYKGPKTSMRYFDKKYNRWRRAREPLKVWRLVWVWPKALPKKKRKGLDLPPNPLQFHQNRTSGIGEALSIEGSREVFNPSTNEFETETWTYTGDLNFLPMFGPGAVAEPKDPLTFIQHAIPVFDQDNMASAEADSLRVAQERLRDKAKAQSVNIAQFIAERKQTIALLAETAARVATAIRDLKRGRLNSAFKSLFPTNSKQLANDVLAFNFGVKPLLSDLDGVAKYLAEDKSLSFDIIASKRTDSDYKEIKYYSGGALPCETIFTCTGFVDVRYKYRISVDSPGIRNMSRLGFSNILNLAYELTPWSFVVDWFLPIGDSINRIDSFVGMDVVHGHRTIFRKRIVTVTRNYGGTSSYGVEFPKTTFSRTYEQIETERVILNTFPEMTLPSFENPSTLTRVVNSIALLRQLRK